MLSKSIRAKTLALGALALSALAATSGCTKTSSDSGIDLQIIVNTNGIDPVLIKSLEFYLDELPGAPQLFSISQLTPNYQKVGDVTYGLTTQDADGDGKLEFLFSVQKALFVDTNALTVPLLGSPLSAQFRIVARVKNQAGAVIGSGESVATNFASPAPTVTVNVCANGVCGGTDAGVDAGVDAGAAADAGADAGAVVDAGADAGAAADAGADAGGDAGAGAVVDAGADAGGGVVDAGPQKSWRTAVTVSDIGGDSANARVGVDSLGNAVVVYRNEDAGRSIFQLQSNRYIFDAGTAGQWLNSATVPSPNGQTTGDSQLVPSLVVTPAGRAYVVYRYDFGANPYVGPRVWGNVMEADGRWDAGLLVNGDFDPQTPAGYPMIALDSSGSGHVVCDSTQGSPAVLATKIAAGAWVTTSSPIEKRNPFAGLDGVSRVAVGNGGIGIAVWSAVSVANGPGVASFNRSGAGGGPWGDAGAFAGSSGDAGQPEVAASPGGVVVVAWPSYGVNRRGIRAVSSGDNGATWSSALLIDSDNDAGQDSEQVSLGIDSNGNAIAVWRQYSGSAWNIWANRFANGQWSGAAVIENNALDGDQPVVSVGQNGQAVAVWITGSTNISGNVYTPTAGWGDAGVVYASASSVFSPRVATDPNGNAVAVWQASPQAVYRIFGAVYR